MPVVDPYREILYGGFCMETADHACCGGGRVCFSIFHAGAEVFRRHPERQILAVVAGVGGSGSMDGDCFRAGGFGYAPSAVLSDRRLGVWVLVWPALDASGDIGRLLYPVSVRALGGPGFRPSPLAAGWVDQETSSRTFRGGVGLCRSPVADQRAGHQFFAGVVAHPPPPTSAWDGLRGSAPCHHVPAGSKRYI